MCGRYELSDTRDLPQRFHTQNQLMFSLSPRYNVAPGQVMPVVTNTNELAVMRWGLIPPWSREASPKGIINARAETASEKPTFKKALQFSRCLVPAGGFYEWQQTDAGKVPYFIHLKDKPLFAFAGIASIWKNATGEQVPTYAILTTEPNELMAPIHNRMPVILREQDEAEWLNPDITEPERLLPLLLSYPANEMGAYPISRMVNSPSIDTAAILEPL